MSRIGGKNMKTIKLNQVLKILFFSWHVTTFSASVYFLRPYEHSFLPVRWDDQRGAVTVIGVGGFAPRAFDSNGNRVSELTIWNADQNALAMLKGFPSGSIQSQTAQQCNIDGDDGVRGHFALNGNCSIPLSCEMALRWHVHKDWFAGVFLPLYSMKVDAVSWTDQTKSITADDILTKTLITQNLATNVATWGNGLSLDGWKKTGLGDCTFLVGWGRPFLQYKNMIKKVTPMIRCGISFPTGVQKNEDVLFSIPFGNDGAYALLLGIGLCVNFSHRVDVGFDCEFNHVFMHTKERRIKVDQDQTEFLLLTKTRVAKDPGFLQRFNLFSKWYCTDYFSLKCAYNYVRRGQDVLYVLSNEYSSAIANTAVAVQEWTTHAFIMQACIDLATAETNRYRPQAFLFWQHPFNGKRSIQMNSIGVGVHCVF